MCGRGQAIERGPCFEFQAEVAALPTNQATFYFHHNSFSPRGLERESSSNPHLITKAISLGLAS